MTEFQALIIKAITNALLGQKINVRNCGCGKFIIAQSPTLKEGFVTTKAQKKVRSRFSAASQYARKALENPELYGMYRKKAIQTLSAFNIASKDFLNAPVVKRIDSEAYTGKPGSTITVKAIDDFGIKKVELKIFNAEGDLVEKGNAEIDPILKLKWIYAAKKEVVNIAGCKIRAIARDHAGNKGELEIML